MRVSGAGKKALDSLHAHTSQCRLTNALQPPIDLVDVRNLTPLIYRHV